MVCHLVDMCIHPSRRHPFRPSIVVTTRKPSSESHQSTSTALDNGAIETISEGRQPAKVLNFTQVIRSSQMAGEAPQTEATGPGPH